MKRIGLIHLNTMCGGKNISAERRISFPARCSGELFKPCSLKGKAAENAKAAECMDDAVIAHRFDG
jgi:hypothetical protein